LARIRTIKPEISAHEGLFDLEVETGLPIRFAWCVLFTVADREGRFVWRARTLKAQILPHDDIDFSRVLDAWLTRGFVVKYRVGDEWFGWIPTFTKHQVINNREAASELPAVEGADEVIDPRNHRKNEPESTRAPRVTDACPTREVHAQGEGKGKERKEGNGKESTRAPDPVQPEPVRTDRPPGWVDAGEVERTWERLESISRDADPGHVAQQLNRFRRAKVIAAIEGYGADSLVEAWRWIRTSPSDKALGIRKLGNIDTLLNPENTAKYVEFSQHPAAYARAGPSPQRDSIEDAMDAAFGKKP
jgi:hypothetical protein